MNTKLFGLFIALLVCLPSLAQQKPVEKVDSDGVYLMPDQMPEFPGGMQRLTSFFQERTLRNSLSVIHWTVQQFFSIDWSIKMRSKKN